MELNSLFFLKSLMLVLIFYRFYSSLIAYRIFMKHFFTLILCLVTLSGCVTSSPSSYRGDAKFAVASVPTPLQKPAMPSWFVPKPLPKPALKTSSKDYYRIAKQVQCVPHARKVSGIPIRGNAHTWWPQAKGKFERSKDAPHVGSVMVLSKTQRLKYGHVAVVKEIIDNRTITVEHANWGGAMHERKIVYTRMPVKDVSANNDWSRARFFNYPSKTFGSTYAVSGFILPNTYMADAGNVAH